MKHHAPIAKSRPPTHGSVLIVVLWVAFGLVSIALYFADAMSAEFRAADNAVCGLAADQAIEGAARYVASVLGTYATNGVVPDLTLYQAAAVPVGEAEFWIIGRDAVRTGTEPCFALVDEASKLNLNSASTNMLLNLPNVTPDFVQAILDWRGADATTGLSSLNYATQGYVSKHARFESDDELRLVQGANMQLLFGADVNRNGIRDDNETATARVGQDTPGLVELCTAFSREPNMSGAGLTNVNDRAALEGLLQKQLGAARTSQILSRLVTRVGGGRGRPPTYRQETFTNLLRFYLQSGMTAQEFARVAGLVTASTAAYLTGRVNINTANATVLACLPGMDPATAQQLVAYRTQNAGKLDSIAWLVDALGAGNTAVQTLSQNDLITTRSYQYTADVAALGPHGRGYRRTRFIFDISTGTARVIYRQDLGRLGWALGKAIRTARVEHASK